MNPRVDVVVLTWNDAGLLDAAVESALGSTGVDVGVVVVDNGSDPPATPPGDERVVLLRNPANRGVAAGRNQGAAAAAAPWLCFLDSDARLAPDCLAWLVAAVADDPGRGMAAPVFTGQAPQASAGRGPSVARKLARGLGMTASYRPVRRHHQSRWEVDFAIGACQLWRRSAFEEVGGFDEGYFYGPEDIDACRRLRRSGLGVVQVADARCDHPPRRRHRRLATGPGLRHGLALARYYLGPVRPHAQP
ncbi:MAG: glycosyltransferase [Actinobacteria bacterium]|nr:glycosyltransferase [Actinomycetota bacterium]MBW3641988.1 glycosyltransferase [Actinomycetota bacterium]